MENKLIKVILLYCIYLFIIGCASQKVNYPPAEHKFFQNYRLLKPGISINEVYDLLGHVEQYALFAARRDQVPVFQRYRIDGSKLKYDEVTTLSYHWRETPPTNPLRQNSFSLILRLVDNKLAAVEIMGSHHNGLYNPPTFQSEASRGMETKVIFDKFNEYLMALRSKKTSVGSSSSNISYDDAKKELLQRYMKKEITKEEYFQIFKELKASYGN
tara:strand:+ start:1221 stop:1865 length:645 start_codon:yes stop_codon:yes gene_type:complete